MERRAAEFERVFDTPLVTYGARLYLTVNLDTGATPAQDMTMRLEHLV